MHFFRMSWEIQFRKKESELDLKLTSLQNLSPESDSTHLENEIDNLLDQLNQVVNKADSSSATSSSSKKWKNLWFRLTRKFLYTMQKSVWLYSGKASRKVLWRVFFEWYWTFETPTLQN